MGLERRGNATYYYRKKRVNGKVISIYCGKAEGGNLAYEQDQSKRLRRIERNRIVAQVKARDLVTVGSLNELEKRVRTLTQETFQLNGFSNHKGQWRKKRNGNSK